MTKRAADVAFASKPITTKNPKHWSLGLLESMKDPESVVKQTKRAVVIKDKYPKAKIHYLVLPHENISSIFKLNTTHISLLEEFEKLYEEIEHEHKGDQLLAGFHAVPSMQRLHMHIISTDMISPCLKTKAHWNSFTTKHFIPYKDLINDLKKNKSVTKLPSDEHKKLMATPLKCNQCEFEPKNIPTLKEHLLTHQKL